MSSITATADSFWPYSSPTLTNREYTMTPEQIRRLLRLSDLQDTTDEELQALTESISEYAGIPVAHAKAALVVIKTIGVIGDLQDKIRGEPAATAQQLSLFPGNIWSQRL